MRLSQQEKTWIDKYNLKIEWSNEDDAYIASVEELPNCMTHGETREEALLMAKEAIEGHLQALKEEGSDIPQPISLNNYSGDFIVRAYPELHKKIVMYSRKNGKKSMNEAVIEIIKTGLEIQIRQVNEKPVLNRKTLPMMSKKSSLLANTKRRVK